MSVLRKLSLKAILLGWLTDIAGSIVASLLVSILATATRHAGSALAASQRRVIVLAIALAAGAIATTLAGYVAGRIGRAAPLANAAVMSILSLALTYLLRQEGAPLWFAAASYVAVPVAALFGGWFASRRAADSLVLV